MSDAIRKFRYQGEESLSLPAERDAFMTLKSWLCGISEELSLPEKTRNQLLIVADEIFTNIASYGYPDEPGHATVAVEFDLVEKRLTLTFSDSGVAYNPLTTPPPDLSKPVVEREIGGLGIFMVKKLMDSVEYSREDNRNVLRMTKIVASPPSAP